MSKKNSEFPWQDKIINWAQAGGIETSRLDNGLGKDTRIAWINTGSGLRYKVVIDRGLDIADAFYNDRSLAWLSQAGVVGPRPDANHDLEWLYSFGGGLLTTCGLTHTGGPETDKYGQRGLHGRISNIPASVESIITPDSSSPDLEISITGKMIQSSVFGPNLELKRTISSSLGESRIHIHDVVTNLGNVSAPHMILYHCNYGWPLADEGAEIIWRGDWTAAGRDMDKEIFNNGHEFRKCPAPMASHCGSGEACAFIDIAADSDGFCHTGLYNSKIGLAAAMKFKKEQLPWLTNWQHWGRGEYVTALEPGTNPPIGQSKVRKQKELIHIEPGENKIYDLEITVLTNKEQIEKFVKTASG